MPVNNVKRKGVGIIAPRATEEIENRNASSQMMVVERRDQQMLGSPSGATGLKATTPCAACKLLRRRCSQDCPFSPYFPPHEPQKFAAVHKVFGASNVSKMLTEVPEALRAETANSLIYEATMRLRDPVYGCMGEIMAMQKHIQSQQAEINAVRDELLKYKLKEDVNNLVSINNNFFAPSISSSAVASFPPSSALISAAPSASHRTPTATASSLRHKNQSFDKHGIADYGNLVNENVRYFD